MVSMQAIEYKVLKVAESCATEDQKQSTLEWAERLCKQNRFKAHHSQQLIESLVKVLYARH